MDKLATKPPPTSTYILSFPAPFILLVTINREARMNSIPMAGHHEGDAIWNWYDEEPELRCAIITGVGKKAFSAGADLIEQRDVAQGKKAALYFPPSGFAGMSRRVGKKPIIAAVNG